MTDINELIEFCSKLTDDECQVIIKLCAAIKKAKEAGGSNE